MPANTNPIFTVTPKITWITGNPYTSVVQITTSGAYDGTSGQVVYTAGANGGFLNKIVCEAAGTNTTNSVLRLNINNGGPLLTGSNNVLFMQYSLPTTTASNTSSTSHIEIPIMTQMPSGYRAVVSVGSSANLGGGWHISAVAGDY